VPRSRRHARAERLGFLTVRSGKNASSVPLAKALSRIAVLVSSVVRRDSFFVYLLDGLDLVLRASKNPHKDALDRLKIQVGQRITGWVAEHK
jgi:uroporphyrinogen-III synthase